MHQYISACIIAVMSYYFTQLNYYDFHSTSSLFSAFSNLQIDLRSVHWPVKHGGVHYQLQSYNTSTVFSLLSIYVLDFDNCQLLKPIFLVRIKIQSQKKGRCGIVSIKPDRCFRNGIWTVNLWQLIC